MTRTARRDDTGEGNLGADVCRGTAGLMAMLAATIVLGLVVDQHVPNGRWLVDVFVWALFVWLLRVRERRTTLLACTAFAWLGELFLSLVWGLYEYRLGGVPLFVPPGHALLFLLGTLVAARTPDRLARLVPWLAAPVVLAQAWLGQDRLGLLLFAMLVLCTRFGAQPKLYAVMFVLALLMELWGTWLGNWHWGAVEPWFALTTTNPPLCAGAFYCVLDLLVLAVQRVTARPRATPSS